MPTPVPFETTPSREPSGAPGGDYQDGSAAPEEFGADIGRGLSSLGESGARATSNLYDIEIAKNHLANELYANDASVPGMQKYTQLWSEFGKLEGSAAQAAVPKFNADIEKTYQDTVKAAPNDQARQLLASPMRSMANYYLRTGQGHADTQFRTWQEKSSNARADEMGNQAAIIASSEQPDWQMFDKTMDAAVDEKRKLFESQGYGLDEQSGLTRKFRGEFLSKIIQEKANDDPIAATHMLDKYADQMDAASRVTAQNKLRPLLLQNGGEEIVEETLGRRPAPGAAPQTEIEGVAPGFLNFIKRTEGFAPQAKWDAKQFTNGYGTKAQFDGEQIDKATAGQRFDSEISKAAKEVDAVNPNLDPGTRAALTSLTFNAGSGWAKAGLGEAVRTGDLQKARQLFLQYNQSEGKVNSGLVSRRYHEASWFGRAAPPNTAALPDKAEAVTAVMNRTSGNRALQSAAISYLDHQYALNDLMTARDNQVFKQRVEDSTSEALTRGSVQDPISEDEFIQRYGPEDGLRAHEAYAQNLQLGADVQTVASMDPQQQTDMRDKYAPQPGEGFEDQSKRLGLLDTAIKKANDEKDSDPGLFAISRLPVVSDAYVAMQKAGSDPQAGLAGQQAAAQRFAEASINEQMRLRAPLDKINILPKAYADNLQAQMNNQMLSGGGEKLAQTVQAQAQLWGKYWPQVYKQVAKEGGSFFRVVGSGVMPDAARDLADVAPLDAKKILNNDEVKMTEVNKAVLSAFKPFTQTTLGQYGAMSLFNDMAEQGTKLASVYVMRGQTPETAAADAYKKLVGFKYDIADSFRLPKQAGYSLDEIQKGQVATSVALNEYGIEPFTSPDPAVSEQYRRDETVKALQRDGVWVTSPNEDGLALIYNGSAVKQRDGKPLIVPWGDLALRGDLARRGNPIGEEKF